MKLLLFSIPGCYPCEVASKELRTHFSHITVIKEDKRSSPLSEEYGIVAVPALVFLDEDGNVISKLVGAHHINKVEVQRIISDFLNC